MKLYLSSYHLGDQAKKLAALFAHKKVALISNALDFSTDLPRLQKSEQRELEDLKSIGLQPEPLDLLEYFHKPQILEEKLVEFAGVWIRGGNCFVLRRAMRYSGLDSILQNMTNNSTFVYAGYSAAACVAGPTLRGIHLADEPEITPAGYESEIIWEGLNLIPYCIAPHYRSNHPESEAMEKVVAYFQQHDLPFKTLRDGEVILGERSESKK